MDTLSRGEIISLIAAIVAILAAVANISVINTAGLRRTLMTLLAVIVLVSIGLLYKIEPKHAVEGVPRDKTQANEAQNANSSSKNLSPQVPQAPSNIRPDKGSNSFDKTSSIAPSSKRNEIGILVWVIVGLVSGILASFVVGGGYGFLGDLLVGIVGAFLGSWIFSKVGWHMPFGGIAGAIFITFIGSIVLLLLLRLVRRI